MVDDKEVCPVCGSSECIDIPPSSYFRKLACPKCGNMVFVGMVKERSFELAVVDWTCRYCGHKWSGSCVLPEKFGVKSVIFSKLE